MSRGLLQIAFVLAGLAIAGAGVGAQDAAKPKTPSKAVVGERAPGFSLRDVNGRTHDLSDYEGRNVVLEWFNGRCRYVEDCHKKRRAMRKAYAEARKLDERVVWLAIDSSHFADAETNAGYVEDFHIAYPLLLDPDGKVGKRYDARTTPHMFVIDAKGVLRYSGRLSNNALGNAEREGKAVRNDVVEALRRITAGKPVRPERTIPWGCDVKYRQGAAAP